MACAIGRGEEPGTGDEAQDAGHGESLRETGPNRVVADRKKIEGHFQRGFVTFISFPGPKYLFFLPG